MKRNISQIYSSLRLFHTVFSQFRQALKDKFNTDPKGHWIKDFIKNTLKYNYKRGSSRPTKTLSEWSKYLQAIFSSQLLLKIYQNRLLINIDESKFTRSVKINYSYLPKGESSSIINTTCTGSTSLIWAFLTNGNWLWMTVNDTTKSVDFWLFLYILNQYVTKWFENQLNYVTLTMDNASIHLTKQSKELSKDLGFEIMTLPPYCPQLAPWELVFGMVKKIVSKGSIDKCINFSKSSGKVVIAKALQSLDTIKTLNMWKNIIHQAKRIIIEVRSELIYGRTEQRESWSIRRGRSPTSENEDENEE